jgi:hypothetical protein
MTALVTVEAVVLVLLTVLVAGLLRSHAEILRRLHALGAGHEDQPTAVGESPVALPRAAEGFAAALDVDGAGLHDGAVHVSIAGTRHRTLLAFLSSGCLTCQTFWDAFRDPHALGLPDDLRLVIVAKDAAAESLSALRSRAPGWAPVVLSSAAWDAYRVPGSPYFVLVDGAAGRVRGEGTGTSWPQVWNLLQQAADDSNERLIDRELLAHGVAPGDPTLYRSADEIARVAHR